MGKREIPGKISLCLFGIVNILMLSGPVVLPAYRSFVKLQYSRTWRNRNISRRNREMIDLTIPQREFDTYKEGRHEIWVGQRLYDIALIKSIGVMEPGRNAGLQIRYSF
ncbi:hypothetical protein [Flavihumibacter fluvii]|uniref:hypothetical protein n=1 Tax=Flavihumibacter fluvii TaxID=2838157 RepID=UPI001BDE32FD|nr:hypothetical protein [Flavihumibacter fluvii]ULQ52841.1 hypothetical protein KJS93_00710 [Flavihumibacter fluvii]